MKKLIALCTVLMSTSLAMAGTSDLNKSCQDKIAKVSKALISVNLLAGQKITSVLVDSKAQSNGEGKLATVYASVNVVGDEDQSAESVIANIDNPADCHVFSAAIDRN